MSVTDLLIVERRVAVDPDLKSTAFFPVRSINGPEIAIALIRRWYIPLVLALVGGVLGYVATRYMKPLCEATASALVVQSKVGEEQSLPAEHVGIDLTQRESVYATTLNASALPTTSLRSTS